MTTICSVRYNNQTAIAGDGQVTLGEKVIAKATAKKIRRIYHDQVVIGFAGGVADAVSLQDMLEGKLETYSGDLRRAAVEMAQSWRKDPTLAKLQAMVIAFNDKDLLLISGNGEVLEPDEDVVAIGSGGNFAQAAAIAMTRHSSGMSASEIAKEAVKIASGIDVFTDDHITTEEKTPKQIVELLDKYIIGQNEAKKSVAVALYNRYRRLQLPKQMQQDITPKNMLMAGPTGVGKTEIARRLAKIVDAPFVKVEATKFTEVGYVGRDVESMVRDLVEEAVRMEEKEQFDRVKLQATKKANNRLVKLIVPGIKRENRENSMQQMMQMLSGNFNMNQAQDNEEVTDDIRNERLSVADQLNKGLLENREVTIEVEQAPKVNPMGDMMGQMGIDMSSLMGDLMPKKTVKRTLKVSDAREVLIQEESKKLINYDSLYQRAIERTQQNGIIFIDEIDKITAGNKKTSGEVSREGVQRDILPIVEGSTVSTKYGPVSTDHILFIAAGAFAESKPSDLIPELQGRFPIRVELNALTQEDFVKILKDPQNSLLKQYIALLKADGIKLVFTQEAIDRIAQIAFEVNQGTDNIGARRLATILEKLLEDVLYEGPDMNMGEITITQKYVDQKLSDIIINKDLTKFIL